MLKLSRRTRRTLGLALIVGTKIDAHGYVGFDVKRAATVAGVAWIVEEVLGTAPRSRRRKDKA